MKALDRTLGVGAVALFLAFAVVCVVGASIAVFGSVASDGSESPRTYCKRVPAIGGSYCLQSDKPEPKNGMPPLKVRVKRGF